MTTTKGQPAELPSSQQRTAHLHVWLSGCLAVWVSAAICALVLSACHRNPSSTNQAVTEPEVTVVTPQQRHVPRFVRATGTLFGDEETTIAAKVSGRIVEILHDLGDSVSPGEPLVRVDPIDYELARSERQHAFEEALTRLGLSELPTGGATEFDIDALPSVERARLQEQNAESKFERARVLAEREPPLISEQDFADLRTAWDVAQSNLKVERLTAQATLAEARTLKAQVEIAEQRVRDTVHRAPEAGGARVSGDQKPPLYELSERMVTVGDFVQIGTPLIRLVDSDPLKLRAPVVERRQGTIKPDQSAVVRVEGFPTEFAGRVSRVSPAVDRATRSFPVEIIVPNSDRVLKPGSFATAEIEIATDQALLLPASAIVTFAGVHKIKIVEGGKIREQRVELGDNFGQMIEVRKGLTSTDQVVERPSAALTTGTAVRIITGIAESSAKGTVTSTAGTGATP